MTDLFVSYNIARKLKEVGFSDECMAFYAGNPLDLDYIWHLNICKNNWHTHKNNTTTVITPMYQQVVDWLYEHHNISLEIYTCSDDLGKSFNHVIRKVGRKVYEIKSLDNKCLSNRYEAMDKGIMEALKLIKE